MKDKILQLVQIRGPILPTDMRKDLNLDSLFIGAYLSELVKEGKLKLSRAKIGGSPVYYCDGQESKLPMLEPYLNEKERRACQALKKSSVLRDSELTPVMKVAMREIKDFAVPLKVNKREIFWRYYLVPQEEAIDMIKSILTKEEEKLKRVEEPRVVLDEKKEEKPEEKKKIPKKVIKKVKRRVKKLEKTKVPEKELKKAVEKVQKRAIEKKAAEKIEEVKKEREKPIAYKQELLPEEIVSLQRGEKIKEEIKVEEIKDPFLDNIKGFCDKKRIIIIDVKIVKPKKEIELIVEVPTVVGNVTYFAYAKDKKRCNEGDLSTAMIKAQSKSLPTLFLTPGDVTKKAQAMVRNEFKQLIVQKVE